APAPNQQALLSPPPPHSTPISCAHVAATGMGEVDEAEAVARAVAGAVPAAPGQRHRLLFQLARRLKALPSLADAPGEACEPTVRRWDELAVASPMRTKGWEESWADFREGWARVRWPARGATLAEVRAFVAERVRPASTAGRREADLLRLGLGAE